MPSETPIEKALKDAVDRALCRVSREPFERLKAEGSAEAARRINRAMAQLGELKGSEQPNYGDRDVALFYSQWYLPRQVNIAYSHSIEVLKQRPLSSWGKNRLLLVDYGAGTGAMIIGLSLAIATQPKHHWPDRILAVQIDHPAMLELGDAIWSSIRDEVGSQPTLEGLARVMDRIRFVNAPLGSKLPFRPDPPRKHAERWLTAIHVIYGDAMKKINADMGWWRNYLTPDVQIRTAPAFKMGDLPTGGELKEIHLLLRGGAPCITELRQDTSYALPETIANLDRFVVWDGTRKQNVPYAATVYG